MKAPIFENFILSPSHNRFMSLHSFPSKTQCCVLLPGLPDFSGRVTTWKSFVLERYASRNRPLLACRRVNPPVLMISKCHNCVLFSCRGRVTTRKSRLGISCASRKRPLACWIKATTLFEFVMLVL
jgi:hypothetical protein